MPRHRVAIAPDAANVIRSCHPELKRAIRRALDALGDDPTLGGPLRGMLDGLWRYRVRRFRIVYSVDRAKRVVQVLAVGPRGNIYEGLADRLRRRPRP